LRDDDDDTGKINLREDDDIDDPNLDYDSDEKNEELVGVQQNDNEPTSELIDLGQKEDEEIGERKGKAAANIPKLSGPG